MWAIERSLSWTQAQNGIVGLFRKRLFSCASLPSLAFTIPPSSETALYRKTMVHQFTFPPLSAGTCGDVLPLSAATSDLVVHLVVSLTKSWPRTSTHKGQK